jgi:hypothetical protein
MMKLNLKRQKEPNTKKKRKSNPRTITAEANQLRKERRKRKKKSKNQSKNQRKKRKETKVRTKRTKK